MKEYREGDVIRTPEGFWLNSDVFRQEAFKFMSTGKYCLDPAGSPSYLEYWTEQLNRCNKGYEVAGEKITGHHYSYLNFCEIELTDGNEGENDSVVAEKETKCPDFWDGDYDYYWCLEIARNGVTNKNSLLACKEDKERINKLSLDEKKLEWMKLVEGLRMRVKPHPDFLDGGHHMIVGKSRRKGYSFKNADICKNTYNGTRKSRIVIGAFDKKYLYPDGTAGKASAYLSFLNKNTAWGKGREYVDKQEHKRASFKEEKDGIVIESGYMSEIIAVTFKDNEHAARGKDTRIVLFEEAGAFPNLIKSYNATRPSVEAGKYVTGQLFVFGTGGDMEGGTADFAKMFYTPMEYNFMPFENIWDRDDQGNLSGLNTYCGFFHPVYLNMEGFYDSQGDSDIEGAIAYEESIREKLRKASTSSSAIQSRVQEYPMSPSEAFLTVSTNDFPIVELRNQYNKVMREKLHLKMGQPVYLKDIPQKKEDNELIVDEEGHVRESRAYKPKVEAKPDLDNILNPIWDYPTKLKDVSGAVVIYEYPVYNPPRGLYKIGFDPYRQVIGSSLAAIYVYKTIRKGDYTRNIIVAQYVGRPYSPNEVNRICVQLCELYNTEVMHENEVTHVKDYFEKMHKLHLLAAQPDTVISAAIKKSEVKRIYGCHMTEKLKDAGEKYIKEWLLEIRDYDETGTALRNIDYIYDPALLNELILFNRKGNFDRCLLGSTKITTNKGVKDIKDVEIGDMVLTVEGYYKKVTNKFISSYDNELYTLSVVGQADNIETTNNHPLLIASTNTKKHSTRLSVLNNIEYKRADSLTDKYQLCLLPKRNRLGENNLNKDLLYLTGWMLGDGSVDIKINKISICLQYNQEEIADKLIEIINELTKDEELTIANNRRYKNIPTQKLKKDGYIKLYKTSRLLTKFFTEQGCIPNNKKISEKLYNTSNLMPLVIGLLEADGHQKFNNIGKYKRCNIEIATIYKDLLLQVRQILLDNGIWSSLSNNIRSGNKDQLRLNISTNYINKLLSYYPSIKFENCNFKCQKEIQIETEVGFWTPISIKRRDFVLTKVYNIEVEDSHTYIAEGIVNHNCMALMQVMFQIAEDEVDKEYETDEEKYTLEQEMEDLAKNQFKNSNFNYGR